MGRQTSLFGVKLRSIIDGMGQHQIDFGALMWRARSIGKFGGRGGGFHYAEVDRNLHVCHAHHVETQDYHHHRAISSSLLLSTHRICCRFASLRTREMCRTDMSFFITFAYLHLAFRYYFSQLNPPPIHTFTHLILLCGTIILESVMFDWRQPSRGSSAVVGARHYNFKFAKCEEFYLFLPSERGRRHCGSIPISK